MNKYIIFNLTTYGNSLLEEELDKVFKVTPYGLKTKLKTQGNIKLNYSYILCELFPEDSTNGDYLWNMQWIESLLSNSIPENLASKSDIMYSLFILLKEVVSHFSSGTIETINIINEDQLGISYTDGSFKKSTNEASYACCVLTDKTQNNALLEDYTQAKHEYNAYSGKIKDATNNIGELTAIKVASDHFGKQQYQLIVSDSEYSVKTFREWYYTWKNNDFKNYSGKSIKNKDLIQEIFTSLFSKHKIIFFKWTKSHVENAFNEKCDELAKQALGITK